MKKSTENSSDKIAVERSEGIRRGALVAFTTIMLTIVMTSISGEFFGPKVFVAGEIATQSVVSPRDFVLEDEKGTSRRREDAIKHVRRIFSLQDDSADGVAQELRGLFTSAAELEKLTANATSAAERDKRSEFERQYQIDLVGHEWEVLLDTEQWRQLEQAVLLMIQPLLVKGIVANRSMLREAIEKGGALVRRSSDGTEFNIDSEDAVYDAASAAEALEVRSVGRLVGQSPAFSSLSKKLARRYIKPNIFFNADETRLRLEETLQSVEPIYFKIRRGEIIVRAGDRVTPNQERKLEQLAVLQSGTHPIQAAVAYSILIAIILVTAYLFVSIVNPQFRPTLRDLSLVSFAVIGNFILIRLNLVLGDALNLSFPEIDANSFLLATPFAAGGIILQVMLGGSSVFLFTLVVGLLAGLFLEHSWLVVLLVIVGNIVGAASVQHCSRRSAFLIAGSRVALVNILLSLCFVLLYPDVGNVSHAVRIVAAAAGGILSGILGAGIAPLAEFFGGYITDIKLLELASLDRPLLQELSLQAPGTWNHSMIMGQMGEAAAREVNANSLLTRVGAYYHDIGKIRKPDYFVENQTGENRHDKLTPSMSALIIKTHVKDGIELAEKHRLPKALVDFIPQHHGTALIEYFFEKAKKEADEGETVDENYFRYAGPKPQTKEAGILMLADVIEASSRTLSEPSPAKIQGLVQKAINKVFASGELDESELRLSDLHKIAKSFVRVLTGIYHRRVEYAEPAEKVREQKRADPVEGAEAPAGQEAQNRTAEEGKRNGSRHTQEGGAGKKSRDGDGRSQTQSGSPETLKRLGM